MVKTYMVFLKSFNPYRIIIWRHNKNIYMPYFAEIYDRLPGYALVKDGLEFYDIIVEPISNNIVIQDFFNNETKMAGNIISPGKFRIVQKKNKQWNTKTIDILSNMILSNDGVDNIIPNITVLNKFVNSVKMHNYCTIQINIQDNEFLTITTTE